MGRRTYGMKIAERVSCIQLIDQLANSIFAANDEINQLLNTLLRII